MKVERTLNLALKIPYSAIFRLDLKKTVVILSFSTFNLSKCNISCKKTYLNVGPKLFYLGIFGLELVKATGLCFFTSAPLIFFKQNFVQK